MAKRRAVKPRVVNGVHVNFEECKQAFRTEVLKLHGHVMWVKAYTNDRKDGIQWQLWLPRVGTSFSLSTMFYSYFPFASRAGCSFRAWTHKSDFDRRQY